MKIKPCALCGGDAKFVYYAIPEKDNLEGWELTEFGTEPMMLLKRIECRDCGATPLYLYMSMDDCIKAWNDEFDGGRRILQRWSEENCSMEETV